MCRWRFLFWIFHSFISQLICVDMNSCSLKAFSCVIRVLLASYLPLSPTPSSSYGQDSSIPECLRTLALLLYPPRLAITTKNILADSHSETRWTEDMQLKMHWTHTHLGIWTPGATLSQAIPGSIPENKRKMRLSMGFVTALPNSSKQLIIEDYLEIIMSGMC